VEFNQFICDEKLDLGAFMNDVWKNIAELGFALSLFANAMFFVPQIIKLIKVKNAQGVSTITFLGFNIIQIFTAIHGYIVHDWILFWGSLLSFIACGFVTVLTIKYAG
jgi:MtN3 and saliva related transmembrane protein